MRILPLVCAAVVLVAATPALAKSARCFTTDDGYFPCEFTPMGGGDFRISASGYPSYELEVDQPGFATVSVRYRRDGRYEPIDGMYVRSRDDGACWNNPETDTKLCAW